MVVHALHIGVDVQRAKPPGECLLLVRRQAILPAQDDHLVIQESLMDFVKGGIGEAADEVSPMDFCAECARQAVNGEGHEPK